MKKNMGLIDRIARVVIALIIGGLYFGNLITGLTGTVLLVIAGIFLLTAFISVCPLYLPFGLSTDKKPQEEAR